MLSTLHRLLYSSGLSSWITLLPAHQTVTPYRWDIFSHDLSLPPSLIKDTFWQRGCSHSQAGGSYSTCSRCASTLRGCHTWTALVTEPRWDPTATTRQSLQAGPSFHTLGCIFRSSSASLLPTFLEKKSRKISAKSSHEYQPDWAPSVAREGLALATHGVGFCLFGCFFGNVLPTICLLLFPHEESDLYESSG